jgi:hypothetical protein
VVVLLAAAAAKGAAAGAAPKVKPPVVIAAAAGGAKKVKPPTDGASSVLANVVVVVVVNGAAAPPPNEKPLELMAAVLGAVVFVFVAELAVLPLPSRGTSHDMHTFFSFGFCVVHDVHFQRSLNLSPKEDPHPPTVTAGT